MSSLYKYSKQLREYLQVSKRFYNTKLEGKKYKLLQPRLFYSAIELLSSQREIQDRIRSTSEEFENIKALKIFLYDVLEDTEKNLGEYISWFSKSFLGENILYESIFNLFINSNCLFISDYSEALNVNQKEIIEKELVEFVKAHLEATIINEVIKQESFYGEKLINIIQGTYFNGALPVFKTEEEVSEIVKSISDEIIIESFEDSFLEIMDITIPEIFHKLTALPDLSESFKDWDELKYHLTKRFNEGNGYGAIFIKSNGSFGIGILPEEYQMLPPISDPGKEVYIAMDKSGICIVEKTTWEDVKSGEAFKKFD